MPNVSLTPEEAEALFSYINEDNDGIDLYTGDLDPALLMKAMDQIAVISRDGGNGELSADSAALAADVLTFFLDSYKSMMQPTEAEAVGSVIPKLRQAATG